MLEVLYEDNHIIIINKKAGDIIQKDKTGDISLDTIVSEYISKKFQKKGNAFIGVVHRLDRPASGVVLFARTSKSLVRLNEMFQAKEISKTYLVVVRNKPIENVGRFTHFLKRNEKKNLTIVFDKPVKDAKVSELEYEVILHENGYYLLKVNLITGRHHQIRAQLSYSGMPIVGDNKYGYPRANKDRSICLHAYSISFLHPVSKEIINVTAPLPDVPVWKLFHHV